MKNYDHKKIEKKWQKVWAKSGIYNADDNSKKPKFYSLIEFPFPSGEGMHVGHLRSNTAMDIISRKRRMEGFNVLYPIGWDAFGLPTENFAIKTGIQPAVVTKKNTDNFRKQLMSAGFSFDWSREINTTDPQYYHWTQWIFLQFFKHGLAYKKKMLINWCSKDKIGLANEEVVGGCCERCGTPVEKREKEQWMLAITKYADRLDRDLDTVDYTEQIKNQQRNWIGKSDGAEIDFQIVFDDGRKSDTVKVFTTRPDTLFGATYIVISPEHSLLKDLADNSELKKYIIESKNKKDIERTAIQKDKTGVELPGLKAVHPATKKHIPVWVADYVLVDYGTGALMAVPAHDERDFAFAKKYSLPITQVIEPEFVDGDKPYCGEGKLINSGDFSGQSSAEARKKITESVGGKMVTTYKLRDWIFSRQRYWGEPIPMVFCEKCGWQGVPEKELPLVLPKIKKYQPTDSGESPLASLSKWITTKCPSCGGPARRETDTMPNWAGSSWYFLRYTDPKNKKVFADSEKLKQWMPVDWYNGGMEHTTLHLLYSRFWNKFLFDIGLVPVSEPYKKRTSHGFILAENGEKMSKSRGNVVNPDEVIATFGADTLRVYEMFMGPFEQAVSWNTDSIVGSRRFIERTFRLAEKVISTNQKKAKDQHDTLLLNQTIKKVGEDIESMRLNTAISSLMILLNHFEKQETVLAEDFEVFLKMVAPFAPHITEELWSHLGHTNSIHLEPWPSFDEALTHQSEVTIAVSVNGKVRAEMIVRAGETEQSIKEKALALESIQKWITGKDIKKVIYVKDSLINIVA